MRSNTDTSIARASLSIKSVFMGVNERQTFESILYFYMIMMNTVNDMTHMTEQDSLVVSLSLPTLAVSSVLN